MTSSVQPHSSRKQAVGFPWDVLIIGLWALIVGGAMLWWGSNTTILVLQLVLMVWAVMYFLSGLLVLWAACFSD